MAIEGSLDLFQLPEILQLISHQGMTGILTVQGHSDIVAISFLEGKVVAADALNQTLEEALGEVLAGQGLVSPADFELVSADHQAGKAGLVDLLVSGEFVARDKLLNALRLHTYRLLVELLGWRSGDFTFYRGDEVSFEEGFVPISVEELLIRSVEEAAGKGHPAIPDSRSVFLQIDTNRTIRVRSEGDDLTEHGDGSIWLTEVEKRLLDQLGDGLTVAGLVEATDSDEYRVRYSLHRLLELGLVGRRDEEGTVEAVAEQPVLAPSSGRSAIEQTRTEVDQAPADSIPEKEAGELRFPDEEEFMALGLEPPTREEPTALDIFEEEIARRQLPDDRWFTAPRRRRSSAPAWPGRMLAVIVLGISILTLAGTPARHMLPFAWQEAQRLNLERGIQASVYARIDRGAKTHYLLESRFPDDLQELVQMELLAPFDLVDPRGRPLLYAAGNAFYEVEAERRDGRGPRISSTEAITGNFLLDREFLYLTEDPAEQPLILLD